MEFLSMVETILSKLFNYTGICYLTPNDKVYINSHKIHLSHMTLLVGILDLYMLPMKLVGNAQDSISKSRQYLILSCLI